MEDEFRKKLRPNPVVLAKTEELLKKNPTLNPKIAEDIAFEEVLVDAFNNKKNEGEDR